MRTELEQAIYDQKQAIEYFEDLHEGCPDEWSTGDALMFAQMNSVLETLQKGSVQCTYCGCHENYRWDVPGSREAAHKRIDAHALVCEADPRVKEIAMLRRRLKESAVTA